LCPAAIEKLLPDKIFSAQRNKNRLLAGRRIKPAFVAITPFEI
jgi:hypothetical protein